jgi:hypothetical protein
MLVLLMASALRHQPPSVVFEQTNELAELHAPIVPTLSAGPCPKRSDDAERRSGYEQLAVPTMLGSAHSKEALHSGASVVSVGIVWLLRVSVGQVLGSSTLLDGKAVDGVA